MANINFNNPPNNVPDGIKWCISAIQSLWRRANSTSSTTGGGGTVTSISSANGNATITNPTTTPVITVVSAAPSGSAGGDLSGTYPNPTVNKVSGVLSSYNNITIAGLGVGVIVASSTIANSSAAITVLTYNPTSPMNTYELKGICDVSSGTISSITVNYTDENGVVQAVRIRGISGNTSATLLAGNFTTTYNLLVPMVFRATNATQITVVTALTAATYNTSFILSQITTN